MAEQSPKGVECHSNCYFAHHKLLNVRLNIQILKLTQRLHCWHEREKTRQGRRENKIFIDCTKNMLLKEHGEINESWYVWQWQARDSNYWQHSGHGLGFCLNSSTGNDWLQLLWVQLFIYAQKILHFRDFYAVKRFYFQTGNSCLFSLMFFLDTFFLIFSFILLSRISLPFLILFQCFIFLHF